MVPAERGVSAPGRGLILRYCLAAAAIAAAIYSTLLASAAVFISGNTAKSVATATHLVPYNSAYLVRRAGWEPQHRTELLERAVSENPFEVQALLRLGLDAEMRRHDNSVAERFYLRAAAVDHLFLPKWTLTNFYFRAEREAEFLKWAKATLEITPYSADPIFAEMWLLDPNPNRLAQSIPDQPSVLWQYAWFLSNARQYGAIPPVVQRLVRSAGSGNPEGYGLTGIIGPIEDRMLANGYADTALDVWRDLSAGGWVKYPAPSIAQPLTNPGFKTPFWNHGFDWVAISTSGIAITPDPDRRAINLYFPGDEPEKCAVLQQWIPLARGAAYTLHWQAAADGDRRTLGLSWHVRSLKGADISSGDLLSTPNGEWQFRSPENAEIALLSLEYARPFGETRAKGTLNIGAVSLKPGS